MYCNTMRYNKNLKRITYVRESNEAMKELSKSNERATEEQERSNTGIQTNDRHSQTVNNYES